MLNGFRFFYVNILKKSIQLPRMSFAALVYVALGSSGLEAVRTDKIGKFLQLAVEEVFQFDMEALKWALARLTDERPDVSSPFVSVRYPFGKKAHGQVDHIQPR